MKACKENRDRLVEYYYNEVDHELRTEILGHLETCLTCQKEFENLRDVLDFIPRDSETTLPDRFHQRVKARVGSPVNKSGPSLFTGLLSNHWMPTLASVLIFLFVGVLTFQFLPTQDSFQDKGVTEEEFEMAENLEILENMELIEILEALEEILQPLNSDQKRGGRL